MLCALDAVHWSPCTSLHLPYPCILELELDAHADVCGGRVLHTITGGGPVGSQTHTPEVLRLQFLGCLKVRIEFRRVGVVQEVPVARVSRFTPHLGEIPVKEKREGFAGV